jgi:hypothetical protein
MKIILSREEVEAILLERVNQDFSACFNTVTFDGYRAFDAATIEAVAKSKPLTEDAESIEAAVLFASEGIVA